MSDWEMRTRKHAPASAAPNYLQKTTRTASFQPLSLPAFATISLLEELNIRSFFHAGEGPEIEKKRFGLCSSLCYS